MPSWVEIGHVFSLFCIYLPLETFEQTFRYFVIINKLEFLSPKEFGWNWPAGSLEEDENVKSLQTTGDQKSLADLSQKQWSCIEKKNSYSLASRTTALLFEPNQ